MPLTRAPKAEADTTVPLPPAPRRQPVLEATTGLVTRPWATWFDLLWKRSGEAHAPSNAELDEGITDNQDTLAALQAALDATQAELDATQAELDATQAELAATQAELAATQAELDATQAAITTTQGDLAALQAELDTTQGDLAALQAELDTTQAQLASDLPPGTAARVVRYQADGTGVEASPATIDATGALTVQTTGVGRALLGDRVGLGTLTPETAMRATVASQVNEVALAVVLPTSQGANQVQALSLFRRSSGDMADLFGTGLSFNIADNAGVDNQIGQLMMRRQGADNSGRMVVKMVNAGTLPAVSAPGDLAVDPVGNVSLNSDILACGGTRVLGLGPGTTPTSSVADTVLLYEADRGGAAGKGSLHVRSEDGTSHVFGDLVGLGTTTPLFAVHMPGRVTQGVPITAPNDTNLGNNQMSIWVNGATLTFRVRGNDGVLKTATLALA